MTLITSDRETVAEIADAKHATATFDFEAALFADYDDAVEIDGQRYRPHSNGGGLVAVTAFVGAYVYVEKTAMVKDSAVVVGGVRILDRAIVEGQAAIADRCQLSHDSRVGGFATLTGSVTLRRHARASGIARLEGGVRLDYYAHVVRGHLTGTLLVE